MSIQVKAGAIVLSLLIAAVVSVALTPKQLFDKDHKPSVSLEALIPTEFGQWHIEPNTVQQVINPSVAAHIANFYSDTLSRTYISKDGDRIMLSLAYGADQSRAMQVHKPEVCYEAQGFKMTDSHKDAISANHRRIPVMRLVAKNGPRNEPITYWIRTGDYVVRGWLEQNIARVKNGLLKGYTPDGLLVRVSTIDDSAPRAYALQDRFIQDLIAATSGPAQVMLIGKDGLTHQP